MKRLLVIAFIALLSIAADAQEVTKFLGIPVDGSKSEMLRKIKAKGFKSVHIDNDKDNEILEGEFNGSHVHIYIGTQSNKVWRVVVAFDEVDEANLKIHYNNLVYQFKNHPKYISSESDDFRIRDEEKISNEIILHNKQYDAIFYQKGEGGSLDGIEYRPVWFRVVKGSSYNMFYIGLFYENGYNCANGEDL